MIKRILKRIGLFFIVKYFYNQIKVQFIFLKRKLNKDKSFCTQTTKRCIENRNSVHYQYQLFGEDSPICCNTHLYEILRDVSKVLEESNITYFINYGTFLGAVRHEGIIPWDTDIDVGILQHDLLLIEEVITKNLSSKYYIVKENDAFLKVYFSKSNTLHLDFDIWIDKKEYLEFHGDIYCGTRTMERDIIFPLKKYKFYDLEVYGPNSTKFLNIVYKDNYMSVGFKKWGLKNTKITIEQNAKPAQIDKNLLVNA